MLEINYISTWFQFISILCKNCILLIHNSPLFSWRPQWFYVASAYRYIHREFRLYMDFDILTGPLSAWELSCVEMVDNVGTRAYMQFDLMWLCINPSHDGLNLKNNSESIGGVVFSDACTHLLLNEHFLTLTCKDAS